MALFVLSKRHNEKVADLFAAHGTMFYSRASMFVHDKQAAEDLVQSAMLELMKSFDRGNPTVCTMEDERLPGYVVGIIRKLYWNTCKKAGREREKVEKLQSTMEEWAVNSPEGQFLKKEQFDLAERAARQLPEHYYEFLMLKYIHHFSKEELAEALGVKVTSLPMIQKRTVELLQKLVEEEEMAGER